MRRDGLIDAESKYRVAIGRSFRCEFGAEYAARAGPVIDHQCLSPRFAEALRKDAADDVGGRAGAERQNKTAWLKRISLGGAHRAEAEQRCGDQCGANGRAISFHRPPQKNCLKSNIYKI